jgi:anti-anti-sigma factor
MRTVIFQEKDRAEERDVKEVVPNREVAMKNDEIVPGFDEGKDGTIRIRLQQIGEKYLVLSFNGYLDLYNSTISMKRIDKAVEAGFVRLIFDCRQLTWVSSTGVGVLLEAMKKTRLRNGDIVLLFLQPKVLEVLELLGFSSFFTKAEDLDEAVHFFDGKVVKEWPLVFRCPICSKKLLARESGRFRCVECKTVLAINRDLQVTLG